MSNRTTVQRSAEPLEYQTCIAFYTWAQYARYRGRCIADYLFHIPNERHCKPSTGRLLKRMGVTAGVNDYFLMIPAGVHHGLFIEFKRRGNALTAHQKNFVERAQQMGYDTKLVFDVEQAIAAITDYLGEKPCST